MSVVTIVVIVCILTLLIHCAETLSYSIRLAGVRTGKLAVSLSLAGILLLVSRTSNMAQSPLAGGLIDRVRADGGTDLAAAFHWIIGAASLGTLAAMVLFPSCVHLFSRMVHHLEVSGSVPRMLAGVTVTKLRHAGTHLRKPRLKMLMSLRYHGVPKRLFLLNTVITACYTVGVLAALYASYLMPDRSGFASQSSGMINGVATILLTIFVDPQLALLTDKAQHDEAVKSRIPRIFGAFMLSRLAGTLLAQLLLIPAAHWIGWIAGFFH